MNFSPLAELARLDRKARRFYWSCFLCYLGSCIICSIDIVAQFIRPNPASTIAIILCVIAILVNAACCVRATKNELRRRRESRKWWAEYRRVWGE